MTRAVTSASNIFRRALCPGSERMESGLPEERDSEEAKEGTLLHKHAAHPDHPRKKLKPSQRDLLEINDKAIREVFQRVADQFGDELAIAHGADNLTWWLHRGIKSLYPGHPDLWEYRPGGLLVIADYKFGFKIVTPAASHLQLRSYAVMGAELHDSEKVVVAITQPRLGFDDRITMAVYNREQIEVSREQLYQIWDDCKKPDAPLVAGEEQCRYCRARTVCPALAAKVNEGMSIIPFPNGKTVAAREAAISNRIAQASDDELGRMYEAVHLAGYVKDPLFEEIRRRIPNGGMPGYKLGKESETREVTDTDRALSLMSNVIAPNRFMDACKVSIGKLEEAIREYSNCTWQEAREKVNTLLGDLIDRKPKKPSVERVK